MVSKFRCRFMKIYILYIERFVSNFECLLFYSVVFYCLFLVFVRECCDELIFEL